MEISVMESADSVVVIDFETTGLSPRLGDRAIEVGAVLIESGRVINRFQRLMNPGFRISSFIENYTGITNAMLKKAPSCAEVMEELSEFIKGHNLVAHNASFDRNFLVSELSRIKTNYSGSFACSMLISRRLYQDLGSHSLGNLVASKKIQNDGTFHRALADSEMTARLWLMMLNDIKRLYKISPSFSLMQRISKKAKRAVHGFLVRESRLLKAALS